MAFSGRRIKRWRDHLGLTQQKLGERVGATGNTIGKYERGESSPPVRKAEQIAAALHVTIYHFLDDEPRQPSSCHERPATSYGAQDSDPAFRQVPMLRHWDGAWPVVSEESWSVPVELLPHDECLVIRMPDESMQPFLRQGDAVVIDPRARVPRSLTVVVVSIEEKMLVRRYKSAGKSKILAASNPCFPAINVDGSVSIVGTVVGLASRSLRGRLAFELASPWP